MLLVVVEDRGQTTMAQGHIEAKEGSVEVSVERETGLVPRFVAYPSSTTVESERVGVMVVV